MTRAANLLTYFYLRHIRGIVTPAQLLSFARAKVGSRPVLVAGERTFSFAQIDDAACRLANALLAAGMAPGEKLAVLLVNSPEFIVARLAAYRAGFVFSALLEDFDFPTCLDVLKEIEAKALVFDGRIGPEELAALRQQTGIERYVAAAGAPLEGVPTLEAFSQAAPAAPPSAAPRAADVSAIGFTSGTTGRSKGVVWPQRAWLASFYHFLRNRDRTPARPPVFLHTLPFSTAGSLAILPGLVSGGRNIVMPAFDPRTALDAIQRHGVTRILTAPVFLVDLWDEYVAGGKKHDLGSLDTITVGSAPMPGAKLEEIVRGLGPVVEQGYGMAEVLAPLARLRVRNVARQTDLLRSAGKPIPEVQVRIDGPDAEGRGRVSVRSASAALGYWKRADLTRTAFRNGWFYSTDIGRLDRSGHLFVLDRLEEAIGKGSRRFFPREIEECIHRLTGVKECAVLWDGRDVTACLAPRAGAQVKSGAVRDLCARHLPPEAVPSRILIVDRLPRSTSGKILKRRLLESA